jgi:hypothetical protein
VRRNTAAEARRAAAEARVAWPAKRCGRRWAPYPAPAAKACRAGSSRSASVTAKPLAYTAIAGIADAHTRAEARGAVAAVAAVAIATIPETWSHGAAALKAHVYAKACVVDGV